MPVTEVLLFPASDEARANPNIVVPASEIVLKSEGVHSPLYYGLQIKEPVEKGVIFISWETYEHHAAIINHPSYPILLDSLKPALGGQPEMYHVEFNADPTSAFNQPITEVLVFTLKAPENRDSVVQIYSKGSERLNNLLVYGKTREDDNKYVVVSGWSSVEAWKDNIPKAEIEQIGQQMRLLTTTNHFYHTKLSKFTL